MTSALSPHPTSGSQARSPLKQTPTPKSLNVSQRHTQQLSPLENSVKSLIVAEEAQPSGTADADSEQDDLLSSTERRLNEARELIKQTGATMQDIDEYREIFELVDTDKGGSIDADELRKLVDLMNMDTSEDELDEMMKEIDTTGDGEIYFPDFVRCMLTKPTIDYTATEVQDAFATLARDGTKHDPGMIPLKLLEEQLMSIGTTQGEAISKDKVDEILGLVEVNGEGMHNYAEFVVLMMHEQREEDKVHEGGGKGGDSDIIQT